MLDEGAPPRPIPGGNGGRGEMPYALELFQESMRILMMIACGAATLVFTTSTYFGNI